MTRAQADGAIRDAAPNAMTDVASGDASGAAPSSAALDATPTDGHVMSSLIEGWGNARAARSSSYYSIEAVVAKPAQQWKVNDVMQTSANISPHK